jgi:mRNA interferase RelE/StbE
MKKWNVELDKRAVKELKKINTEDKVKILDFLQNKISTSENPRRYGKALTSTFKGLWRYRVGSYRVVCTIRDDIVQVLVIRIAHRNSVYNH